MVMNSMTMVNVLLFFKFVNLAIYLIMIKPNVSQYQVLMCL